MKVLKLSPGLVIRDPADERRVIGVVADGRASLVVAERSDEPLEALQAKAQRIAGCQRVARTARDARLDKKRQARKNSGG